jgi:hypothetical protein
LEEIHDGLADEFGSDGEPLLLRGEMFWWYGFSGAGIPVACVAEIALLTVEPGVDP